MLIPKKNRKKLESGNLTIKSEPKAPLIHLVIGNTEMETKQLVENLQALIGHSQRQNPKSESFCDHESECEGGGGEVKPLLNYFNQQN